MEVYLSEGIGISTVLILVNCSALFLFVICVTRLLQHDPVYVAASTFMRVLAATAAAVAAGGIAEQLVFWHRPLVTGVAFHIALAAWTAMRAWRPSSILGRIM